MWPVDNLDCKVSYLCNLPSHVRSECTEIKKIDKKTQSVVSAKIKDNVTMLSLLFIPIV